MKQDDQSFVLIAVSARALAQSAARAGYRVHVIDLFADQDTRSFAQSCSVIEYTPTGFCVEQLRQILHRLFQQYGQMPIIFGSGFERSPGLLDELAQLSTLLGCSAKTLNQVCDPEVFFPILSELGVPHPDTELRPDRADQHWLVKHKGAFGGAHIRRYQVGDYPQAVYFQREIEGQAASILMLADAQQAQILGYQQIWSCAAMPTQPYIYGGAVSSVEIREQFHSQLEDLADRLSRRFSLRGLCGIDFIIDRAGQIQILEINPRPPATLDLYRDEFDLMSLHLQACRGQSVASTGCQPSTRVTGHRIVYAARDATIPMNFVWPSWVSDIPVDGQTFSPGEPVCTIHARGGESLQVKQTLLRREHELLSQLDPCLPG